LKDELETVDEFINYVLSCMEDGVRQSIEVALDAYELGMNKQSKRFGVLFSGPLVDARMGPAADPDPPTSTSGS